MKLAERLKSTFAIQKKVKTQKVEHATVIRHGSRSFALGVTWFTTEDQGKQRMKRATAQATGTGDDLYCLPRGSRMFGTANRLSGMAPKAVAAAAILSRMDGLGHNVISVIEVSGGYWFCAVRSGMVATVNGAPGDMFFRTSDIEDLNAHYSLFMMMQPDDGDWQVYSPQSLSNSIPGLSPIDLADLSRIAESFDELKVARVVNKPIILMVAVAIGVVGVGAYSVHGYFEAKRQKEEIRLKREAQRKERREAQLRASTAAEMSIPWRGKPHPYDLSLACEKAIENAYLAIPGWQPYQFECTPRGVGIVYQVTPNGRPSQLIETVRALGIDAQFDGNGKTATWAVRLPEIQRKVTDPVEKPEKLRELLWSELNNYGVDVNATIVKKGQAPSERNPSARQYRMLALNFEAHAPLSAFQIFQDLNGITLDRMILNFKTMTWNMETKAHDPL